MSIILNLLNLFHFLSLSGFILASQRRGYTCGSLVLIMNYS